MDDSSSRAYEWNFHGGAPAAGDPRLDVIELGPLRGRRAVTLGLVEIARRDVAVLVASSVCHGGLRDHARALDDVLRILERVARLPADPATDYAGTPPGGVSPLAEPLEVNHPFPLRE